MKKYRIPGWQSWSPHRVPFLKIPSYFYSPHGVNSWSLKMQRWVKNKKPIKGWCSWYAYGLNITEEKILQNANKLDTLWPGRNNKYVLIDDGWTLCGDWNKSNSNNFPGGMANLAKKIRLVGSKPGLWIAPFWGDPKSDIFKKHPEYFVKTGDVYMEGFPLLPFRIPFINFRYVLDMENPRAVTYLKKCIETIVEVWGFELLKLDFLNTIYFNPKYKDSKVPDRILGDFLTWLRKKYPNLYLIGCGCPLGPAVGKVDAMRISADITNPHLQNIWPINSIFNLHRLKQLENNLKYRKNFSKIWHIDPDVFVTSEVNGFGKRSINRLFDLIVNARGIFFLGDDLTKINLDTLGKYKFPARPI